jgi:leucyl aminopeptidase (aminopeptidase T)
LFEDSVEKSGGIVKMLEVKGLTTTRKEPPKHILKEMKQADIVLGITTISLTHTKAVRAALACGARVATMPGITMKMIPALGVDYRKLVNTCDRLRRKFAKSHNAHITTKKGTDISLWFTGRKISMDDGILDKPGSLHNLPSGETGVAPIESSADGKIVVDVCMVGVKSRGRMKNPIIIHVKKGRISRISGNREAEQLRKVFRRADKNGKTISEFAIGTNFKSKLIGNVLNDEKAYGTCHFAFGDNKSLGGKTQSNVHLDGVVNKPTIRFDDKLIMKDGRLV